MRLVAMDVRPGPWGWNHLEDETISEETRSTQGAVDGDGLWDTLPLDFGSTIGETVEFEMGIDEAGRGCLWGPVVVAGVCWDPSRARASGILSEVFDSKTLTPRAREALVPRIRAVARVYVAIVSHVVIDVINILRATLHGMEIVGQMAGRAPIFIDGRDTPAGLPGARAVVKGDRTVPVISAASIVAKVFRDQWVDQLATHVGKYDLTSNKGYGTKRHLDALQQLGPSAQHRKSFAPVAKLSPDFGAWDARFLFTLESLGAGDLSMLWKQFLAQYERFSLEGARRAVMGFQRCGLPILPSALESWTPVRF